MPSLNLKTKTLRYAKADESALDACMTLLDQIVEYDTAAKKDAESARSSLAIIRTHVRRQRKTESAPPEPKQPT